MSEKDQDEKDVERRRDEALRRALRTPQSRMRQWAREKEQKQNQKLKGKRQK